MAAPKYRAKIDHTEKTILRLYKTQFYCYSKLYLLIRALIGFVLILIAAAVTMPTWLRAVLLLLGAWLVVSVDFPSQVRADRALQERKAALPSMRYEFFDDRLKLSGEGSMDIPYKKLTRLVRDEAYLYLFLSRDSVCMLDCATLKPEGTEDFMQFIAEKTGLNWQQRKSFLALNFYDIRQSLRDMRRK